MGEFTKQKQDEYSYRRAMINTKPKDKSDPGQFSLPMRHLDTSDVTRRVPEAAFNSGKPLMPKPLVREGAEDFKRIPSRDGQIKTDYWG